MPAWLGILLNMLAGGYMLKDVGFDLAGGTPLERSQMDLQKQALQSQRVADVLNIEGQAARESAARSSAERARQDNMSLVREQMLQQSNDQRLAQLAALLGGTTATEAELGTSVFSAGWDARNTPNDMEMLARMGQSQSPWAKLGLR